MQKYFRLKFFSLALLLLQLTACSLPSNGTIGSLSSPEPVIDMQLIDYDLQSFNLKLKGDINKTGTTPKNRIDFFTNQQCIGTSSGGGLLEELTTVNGIKVSINYPNPRNSNVPIYFKTNTLADCFLIGNYAFNVGSVPPPKFTSTSPLSPSRDVVKPTLFGTAQGKLTLRIYSDSSCSALIGSGTSEDFASVGYLLNLNADQVTQIYGQATDVFATKSTCSLLTTYEHTTAGPTAPGFVRFTPNSPSKTELNPAVVGTLSNDSVKVRIFDDANCSHLLSEGPAADYKGNGILFLVDQNTNNKIYAVAFNNLEQPSACTYISTYVHDSIAPTATVAFTAANPASPTRLTVFPKFMGVVAGTEVNSLRFYSDVLCLQQAGVGSRNDFEVGTGITVNVPANLTSQMYVRAFDEAGNGNACALFTTYRHNTIPPNQPIYDGTTPISPNNISYLPYIFGSAAERTRNLFFFSDELCTVAIGSGTAAAFNSTGVQLTTANVANSVNLTSVYVQADDDEGNLTECSSFANYAYSTKPATAASFLQTIPPSPSRFVYRPWVLGTAPNTVVNVKLFSDNACTALVGQASRSVFASQGIQVNLLQNKISSLYAISTDVYGNTSPCVFFTSYTHDEIATDNPVYISTVPSSPNRTSSTPTLIGSVLVNLAGKPLPINTISVYDNFLCLGAIGASDPSSFVTTGVPIIVNSNANTTLYAQSSDAAGNVSVCSSMTTYTHSNRPTGKPNFIASTPTSPSYRLRTSIKGAIGSSTSILPATTVRIFSDASCSALMATAPVGQYTGSGVTVTALNNVTTSLYATTSDVVGNSSACTLQVNYVHSDVGASNLTATQNQNGSISLDWSPDLVASPSPKYTVKRAMKSGGPYSVLVWENSGTSFTDMNVTNGVTYFYVVSALNNTGYSLNSAEASITVTSQNTVTPLSLLGDAGDQIISLSWTGAAQNMFYDILRSTTPGGPYSEVKLGLSGSSYDDKTVVNNSTYYYVVRGVNPTGQSVFSNQVSVTAVGVPNAPTGLQVTMILNEPLCGGSRAARLSWNAPTHYRSFNIKGGLSAGSMIQIGNTTALSFLNCNPYVVNPPFDYSYAVTALWGPSSSTVESIKSNVVSILAQDGPAVSVYPGHNEAFIKWNPVTNATHYDLWRSTQPGWKNEGYQLVASTITGLVYHDTSVVDGQNYFYVVVPYRNTSVAWPSIEKSGIPSANPGQPSNLTLSMNSGGVGLHWSPPTHYNYFNVYVSSTSGGPYTFVGQAPNPTYVDSPLTTGQLFYVVATQWGSYESAYSNEVSVYYGSPLTVTLVPKAASLDLTWSAVSGATSYNVKRGTLKGGPYTIIANTAGLIFSNSDSNPVGNTISAGEGYYYVIQPEFPGPNAGQNSNEVSGSTTGSTVVAGLSVAGTSSNSVNLSWIPITGTTSYTVYRASALAGPYTSIGTSATKTYTANGLVANTQYYFKVARTTCNTACQSAAVLAVTNPSPSAPSTFAGLTSIDVSWVGVIGAMSYDLLRSTDNNTFTVLQSGVSGGNYTDSAVVAGTQYFYKLRVTFASGQLTSPAALGCTPGAMPNVPRAVSIFDNSNGTDVGIEWAAVSGATGYMMYYSTTSGGPWTLAGTTSSTAGNYILGLTTGTNYYITIAAAKGSVESAKSAETKVMPSTAPAAPTINATSSAITVNYSAVAGAATYDILRSNNGGIDFNLVATGVATNSYTDTSVISTETYVYIYRPYSGAGSLMATSAKSPAVSTVALLGPSVAWAEALTTTSVKISWSISPSPLAASYRVYRSTTSGGPYSAVASGLPSTTYSYIDSTASAGQSYYFVIVATDSYNLESGYSSEAKVRMVAGPAGLTATAANSKNQLSWGAVAGATAYQILRSAQSGGSYGLLGSVGSGTFNFDDTQIQNGFTYYYVVRAQFAGGLVSVNSNEASALAQRLVNLQVPVEMVDQALSSDNVAVTFDRTLTSIEPAAYDGTVTYELEVVASNSEGAPYNVNVVDEGNSVVGSLVIPAGTTDWTRFKTALTLLPGLQNYRLQLSGTSSAGSLQVFAARILINQVNATRTKIYYPLLASSNTPLSGDVYAPIYMTNNTDYQVVPASTIYHRDPSRYSRLFAFNSWEFEAVVASQGGVGAVALYNTNTSSEVEAATVQFSQNSVALIRSPFSEGVQQFSSSENGNNYRVAAKCVDACDVGPVGVYRAGLWMRLTDISKVEIVYRNVMAINNVSADLYLTTGRNAIDLGSFSNPVVSFRATGSTSGAMSDSTQVELLSTAGAASGTAGTVTVAGSTLSFTSNAVSQIESGSTIGLISNDNVITRANAISGQFNLIDSQIVIRISP